MTTSPLRKHHGRPLSTRHDPVPFVDLAAEYEGLREEVLPALDRVAASGRYALGPEVEAFETEFAHYVGTRHCVAVNSGTSALHLALIAAGVGPGDEVVVPAMTFVATAWAVSYVGAKPVLADIDPRSYTMDVDAVEHAISSRTRAVIPVHLYGQPADMAALRDLAQRTGVTLIEDAAQAHGATYGGQRVGAFGRFGCFSFYPAKNLGAFGEGGAIVTDDDGDADRIRALRDHAQHIRYRHDELGFNYRMDALQGAVLRIKLRGLDVANERRHKIATWYEEGLADLPLGLPQTLPERCHVWHLYVVRHNNRDRLREQLAERGIAAALHYPVPIHLQPAYADLGHEVGEFPVAERLARECLSLPMFPRLSLEQVTRVAEAIAQSLAVRSHG